MQPLLISFADDDVAPAFLEAAPRRRRLRAPTDLLRLATIRARLFATFSLMCVLMAVLGAAAWWATATENKALNLFVSGAVTSLRAGGDLRVAFVDTRAREKEVLLAIGQAERQATALRAWRDEVALVKGGMVRMRAQLRDPRAAAITVTSVAASPLMRWITSASTTSNSAKASFMADSARRYSASASSMAVREASAPARPPDSDCANTASMRPA